MERSGMSQIDKVVINQPLTEEWLKDSGFKYYQEERQPQKHWQLWLGWGSDYKNSCNDDIGVEVSMAWWFNRNQEKIGDVDGWHCWIISGKCARKLIHVRLIYTENDLINLAMAITGKPWKPENHMYGNCYNDQHAEVVRGL